MSNDEHRARKAADQRRSRARRPRALRNPGQSDRWDKPYRVLTGDQVDEIRRLSETGKYTQSELAERFGIHESHVSRLVRKERR